MTQKKEYTHFHSLVTNKILRLIQLLKFVANTGGYIYVFPLVASL